MMNSRVRKLFDALDSANRYAIIYRVHQAKTAEKRAEDHGTLGHASSRRNDPSARRQTFLEFIILEICTPLCSRLTPFLRLELREERITMWQGGCFCGAVRYQINGDPISSGICHCRTCRKIASSPSLPFVEFPTAALEFTRGNPVEFRSSPLVTRRFCANCGSPLTYQHDNKLDRIDVMTCSLDDPEIPAPSFHVWVADKLNWNNITDGRPAFPASRKSR
jgi:hypothetical protein